MKKILCLFLVLGSLFISACNQKCESGIYASNGKCCGYVCDIECENGYKEGTCNCECKITDSAGSGYEDTNIDNIFDDSSSVEPPPIPT